MRRDPNEQQDDILWMLVFFSVAGPAGVYGLWRVIGIVGLWASAALFAIYMGWRIYRIIALIPQKFWWYCWIVGCVIGIGFAARLAHEQSVSEASSLRDTPTLTDDDMPILDSRQIANSAMSQGLVAEAKRELRIRKLQEEAVILASPPLPATNRQQQ